MTLLYSHRTDYPKISQGTIDIVGYETEVTATARCPWIVRFTEATMWTLYMKITGNMPSWSTHSYDSFYDKIASDLTSYYANSSGNYGNNNVSS